MNALTEAQHARLDSLAQVRKGPFRGARVVGLVLGNAPVIQDAHGRRYILNRRGELLGSRTPPLRPRVKRVPVRKSQRARPIARFVLSPAERAKYEGREP